MIRWLLGALFAIACAVPMMGTAQTNNPGDPVRDPTIFREPRLPGRLPGDLKIPGEGRFKDFRPTGTVLDNCRALNQEGGRVALPDEVLDAAVATAIKDIGSAQASAVPSSLAVKSQAPKADREARRALLASESLQAGEHVAALRVLDAQAVRLAAVTAAISGLRGLQSKHEQRAQTNDLPFKSALIYTTYSNKICETIYGNNHQLVDLERMQSADLAIAEPLAAILLAPKDNGIRPAVAGSSPYFECGGMSLTWSCAPLSPGLTSYYLNDKYKCTLQGLLTTEAEGGPTFGCVSYRREDGPPPSLTAVRAFYVTMNGGVGTVAATTTRFAAGRKSLAVADRAAAQELSRQLAVENDDLVAWRTALDTLKAEIDALNATIATEEQQLTAATSAQTTATARLDAGNQAVAQVDQSIASAEASLVTLDAELAQAQAAEQAVTLNCGGASVETCTDASAKLDFERRRYEARQTVMACRQKRLDARLALSDRRKSRRDKLAEVQAARVALVPLRVTIGEIGMLLPQNKAHRDARVAKYEVEAPAQVRLAGANSKDQSTLADLEMLIGVGG